MSTVMLQKYFTAGVSKNINIIRIFESDYIHDTDDLVREDYIESRTVC